MNVTNMAEQESDNEDLFTVLDPEFMAVLVGLVTLVGSALGYFFQRNRERHEEAEADKQKAYDLDRQQALNRVRTQLSVFVGPLHRLYKTQNTVLSQYRLVLGQNSDRFMIALSERGRKHWMQVFVQGDLDPYIDQPMSLEAQRYRNMISRRLKPLYTRIRELILAHASDLADMPTQEEWLEKYDRESVTSPYLGSINISVIFDTFTAWTFEFDDIIESWNENDFSRMQPTTEVAWIICNDIVDTLYDNAKMKEATYNKHVKVHRNLVQQEEQTSFLASRRGVMDKMADSTISITTL